MTVGRAIGMAALAGLLALLPGAGAIAQQVRNSGLDALERREKILGWEAVGRLDIEGGGFCTATLIETRLLLTAAHCVHDRSGRPIAPSRIVFRAGVSGDSAIATARAGRIASHPRYDPQGQMSAAHIRYDLALVELAEPIPAAVAAPFPVQAPGRLTHVSVVSYARDRADHLSWQRSCAVTGQGQGLMEFDCDVYFGSSGAPVFDRSGARARIVSVISAGRRENGRSVSYGMELPALVGAMKAQLRSGRDVVTGYAVTDGASPGAAPAMIRRIGTEAVGSAAMPGARATGGAKFLRP